MEQTSEQGNTQATRRTTKKKDPFIENTNKILEGKGIDPKQFDKEAIREARQQVYNEFVEENIGKLL